MFEQTLVSVDGSPDSDKGLAMTGGVASYSVRAAPTRAGPKDPSPTEKPGLSGRTRQRAAGLPSLLRRRFIPGRREVMTVELLKQFLTLTVVVCLVLTTICLTVAVVWTVGYYIFALWTSQVILPNIVKPL
jgi:hypothetical protein